MLLKMFLKFNPTIVGTYKNIFTQRLPFYFCFRFADLGNAYFVIKVN